MSDEDQTPWLAGLPEEPEPVEPTEAPAEPEAVGVTTYEPFHWTPAN